MRIIPVIDLRRGIVVHAVRGERERYRPIMSTLTDSFDPQTVAQVFRERLGLKELYVADLDAIEGNEIQWGRIAGLAQQAQIMVDAGVWDRERVRRLLDLGVHGIIVGSETLANWEAMEELSDVVSPDHRVFSLDIRAGHILTRDPWLATQRPLDVLGMLQEMGWNEVILLDLARVGTASGPDVNFLAEARRRYPELTLLVGGGIRHVGDLRTLRDLGVDGVLVATAFHRGAITAADLRLLGEKRLA